MSKTTILIETQTRDNLRHLGRKGMTYDEIIRNLIYKRKERENKFNPQGARTANLSPSGSE